ncbi:MAG: hypothetical protein ACXACB_12425, partial [Promethearchaeota archaeon]
IDMSVVSFAKDIIERYLEDVDYERGIVENNGVTLENVSIWNKSQGERNYIHFAECESLNLNGSAYYVHFRIPKQSVLEYETLEINLAQTIKITTQAYRTDYMLSINHILQDWGKIIQGLMNCSDDSPMLKFSVHKALIGKILSGK